MLNMALKANTDWRLGTMGFGYVEWSGGVFYPEGLKSGDYLAHYAHHFDAVELDTTFYATPMPDRVQKWADATPPSFRFAAKVPRQITHEGSIDRAVEPMVDFLHVMRRGLGEKLGVVLLQFPPSFTARETPKLERFLRMLPNDIELAAEFRHESWWTVTDATAHLLRSYRVAWASAEYVAEPRAIVPTTEVVYVRLIGEHHRFKNMNAVEIDVTPKLQWWRDHLAALEPAPKQVWVLFNNDFSGFAIETARQFRRMLDLPDPQPHPLPADGLFA
jgi:uncharacterized protein YecE (DUF72 family)